MCEQGKGLHGECDTKMAALLKHFQVQVPVNISNSLDVAYTIINPTTSDRVQLSKRSEEKDLGIWHVHLRLKNHQHNVIKPLLKLCKHYIDLIKRSSKFISKNPCLFFTNFMLDKPLNIMYVPYQEQLATLGLYSLFCCRQRGDLIGTFKIINEVNDVHIGFTLSNNSRTRGNPYKLVKQRSHLNL